MWEGWKRGLTKECEKTLGVMDMYLDCGDDFKGINISQNYQLCTLNGVISICQLNLNKTVEKFVF